VSSQLFNSHLKLEGTLLGTGGSAAFIYLPKLINALYNEQLREMVLPPSQNFRLLVEMRRRGPNLTRPLEVASV